MHDFDPYAAPQAQPPAARPLAMHGEPQPWGVGEVIRSAWEVFEPNWAPLCVGAFVMALVSAIPQQVPSILQLSGVLEEDAIASPGSPMAHTRTPSGWCNRS